MAIPLIFVRAGGLAKKAIDWFTFANDTIAAAGIVKRAVAGTAGAAVIAGAGVGAVKAVEVVTTSPQERAISRAIAGADKPISPDVREKVLRVNSENLYSISFLRNEKNEALLDAIIELCDNSNALPSDQCVNADEAHGLNSLAKNGGLFSRMLK